MQRIAKPQSTFSLALACLGVVYGDIGTSPLYAMRASLGNLPANEINILGILSLIVWSLIFIISLKYLTIIFQADNDGEGGVLALLALVKGSKKKTYPILFSIGILGGGLMLGDGMLTPAISVMSAIEGLNLVLPNLADWVLPVSSCIILIILFSLQHLGTAKIGFTFGPIIFIWFFVIAFLGLIHIVHNPVVLKAISPWYAFDFFVHNGWKGYTLLGGVFLVVTGGEALFADLGHFGKNPIRWSWYVVVLPALILNYLGQGAYLLKDPTGITNPFFVLAPPWFIIPLIIIATIATVIASQAVISAVFSLTKQAVLLGLYPHLPIIQTSATERVQIYVPQMNFIIAIGTLLLVLAFRNSSALAHAYGVAVNLVMVLTTIMIIYIAHYHWKWSVGKTFLLLSIFIFIDLMFLGANVQKIATGGWVPLLFASFCGFIMYTWNKDMEFLRRKYYMKKEDLSGILKQLHHESITMLPNITMIFITDTYDKSGGALLHFLKLCHAIPENILILSYVVENIPYVHLSERFEVTCLDKNICQLVLHYGFMDFINVPAALKIANKNKKMEFFIDMDTAVYLVEIPNTAVTRKHKTIFGGFRDKIFAFLTRNYSANINIEFYHLPYNKTMAIGTYNVI